MFEFLVNCIDNFVENNSNYNDCFDFLVKVLSEKFVSLYNLSCVDFVIFEFFSIVGCGYLNDLVSFVCYFFIEGEEELEVNLYNFYCYVDEGEKLVLVMI